jgi:succinate dehydrogenase / fumarate reductase, membrane anchor subunit
MWLSGHKAWLLQRVSAIYLGLFLPWLCWQWASGFPDNYPDWQAFLSHTAVSISGGLFFLALLAHAWVGVRDILLDYMPVRLRPLMLLLLAVFLLTCAVWTLLIWTRMPYGN